MAKPTKLQMVVTPERTEVTLKDGYHKDMTMYINGVPIEFTDSKASVIPEVAELLKSEGYIL